MAEKEKMVTSWKFGHDTHVDEDGYVYEGGVRCWKVWRYSDNNELVKGAAPRACPKCGECETEEGHDPCIANLPGVRNACCGHGRKHRYIQLDNEERTYLTGKAMNDFLKKHGRYDGG